MTENSILGLQRQRRFQRALPGTLHWGKVRRHAEEIIETFDVVAAGASTTDPQPQRRQPAKARSGPGIQQAAVPHRGRPATRGLDVSAATFIRDLLVDMRNQGQAVLLVSADLDETLSLADRIAVMYEGEILAVLAGRI